MQRKLPDPCITIIKTLKNVFKRLKTDVLFQKQKTSARYSEICPRALVRLVKFAPKTKCMESFCRECGAPLSGRPDKQFCNNDCRTAWHNRNYYKRLRPMAAVNRILSRNRRLLERAHSLGLRSISLSDSRMAGYDVHFFTSLERPLIGPAVYHIYEYSFCLRGNKICSLAKN